MFLAGLLCVDLSSSCSFVKSHPLSVSIGVGLEITPVSLCTTCMMDE
jgi:hypothetical protein